MRRVGFSAALIEGYPAKNVENLYHTVGHTNGESNSRKTVYHQKSCFRRTTDCLFSPGSREVPLLETSSLRTEMTNI
jgi:hypothetical protein